MVVAHRPRTMFRASLGRGTPHHLGTYAMHGLNGTNEKNTYWLQTEQILASRIMYSRILADRSVLAYSFVSM